MDDGQLGSALRLIRQRKGWRQVDLAERAGIGRWRVSLAERGHAAEAGLPGVRRIVAALDGRLDLVLRWHGGDLDRLLNRRHSALHEAVAQLLGEAGGWQFAPEVSFSVYGERGFIDVLAWHPGLRMLLVIELKTMIVDVNELMGLVDRKRRLAMRIARERSWAATAVSAWVVVEERSTNRRRLSQHVTVLRAAFPDDGRTMRGWLRNPVHPVAALSFLSIAGGASTPAGGGAQQRVRKPVAGPATLRARMGFDQSRRARCVSRVLAASEQRQR